MNLCCSATWTQVKLVEQGVAYLVLSGLITTVLALLPLGFRLAQHLDLSSLGSLSLAEGWRVAVGSPDTRTCAFFFITTVQRVCLTGLLFFMMCVAERTYKQVCVPPLQPEDVAGSDSLKGPGSVTASVHLPPPSQRLLFAKYFSHITSARKARKSEIPHFRLKKVQNIKMWLSLRSFLRVGIRPMVPFEAAAAPPASAAASFICFVLGRDEDRSARWTSSCPRSSCWRSPSPSSSVLRSAPLLFSLSHCSIISCLFTK